MKKLMHKAALAAAVLALTACGGGGNDSKDLFSLWVRDGDGGRIDFSGAEFSTPFLISTFDADASQCNCTVYFVGTQESGRAVVNQCYFVSSPKRDPGCSSRGGTFDYSKSGNVLTVTAPTGTFTYR